MRIDAVVIRPFFGRFYVSLDQLNHYVLDSFLNYYTYIKI